MNNVTEQDITNTVLKTTVENPVIDIRQLKKSFGSQEILKDITLQLASGENLVVMGKSGSGKSVLIKCLVGLLKPDSGSITILEQDVTGLQRKELNELRQKIGFLFQSGALYDSMTVKQNIEFPLRRIKKGLTENEIAAKVQEVLENVDLVDALNKMPSALSGGMRKRISLARTIVVDPLIMLYDEPTTGLDPVTSDEISALIMDVQKKYKTSSIIITHDIKCALHTANRMIMLKDGTVFKEGKPEEFKQSTDEYIQSFSFQ
ncbi:ABC transporter ATP-binding protein [Lacibacter sp.]|uniref:ABC transporter ATP-binding protein n=1 Tax=Lacibacter sp. TaxID=1915409 RepID=UPI002B4B3601|nr:ATP-binding cassette domain-containing protein [Lacibacter sp.]HLP36770.1 ATP-binding cassette domain-containing protein [Lacibacter sp.]